MDDARPTGALVAVIPLKALPDAKQRLSPTLDIDARRRIMVDMFDHVVSVCLGAPQVDRVLVVAGDGAAEEAAHRHGVEVLRDRGGGLNAAIALADHHVEDEGQDGATPATLVVAADLPRVKGNELDELALLSSAGPCVLVAPTTDGGTGALLRRPGGVIAPAYGPASAARHLRAAAQAGVRSARVHLPGLASDVDRPADLGYLADRPSGRPFAKPPFAQSPSAESPSAKSETPVHRH